MMNWFSMLRLFNCLLRAIQDGYVEITYNGGEGILWWSEMEEQ